MASIRPTYFPTSSPSSKVSGSFLPSVSGSNRTSTPATKEKLANIINGSSCETISANNKIYGDKILPIRAENEPIPTPTFLREEEKQNLERQLL